MQAQQLQQDQTPQQLMQRTGNGEQAAQQQRRPAATPERAAHHLSGEHTSDHAEEQAEQPRPQGHRHGDGDSPERCGNQSRISAGLNSRQQELADQIKAAAMPRRWQERQQRQQHQRRQQQLAGGTHE